MSGPKKLMFIRHAEKPEDGATFGVAENGTSDKESLTPRGWQRAGALASLFDAPGVTNYPGLARPDAIYAASVEGDDSSRRPLETATPLAARLAVHARAEDGRNDFDGMLAKALGEQDKVVLVSWEHQTLAAGLAKDNPLRARTRNSQEIPNHWPGLFVQVPQPSPGR